MIGIVQYIRFCCDNPPGSIWHHDSYHILKRVDKIYFTERVNGEHFALEVERGILRPIIVKNNIPMRASNRLEIWQVDK